MSVTSSDLSMREICTQFAAKCRSREEFDYLFLEVVLHHLEEAAVRGCMRSVVADMRAACSQRAARSTAA